MEPELLDSILPFSSSSILSLEPYLLSILLALILSCYVILKLWHSKLRRRMPPGPNALPIFGNWLRVGDDLNPFTLSQLAKQYGDIFLLRMGHRNLVIVSSPALAKEVLHTQGIAFGSRPRNVVLDIFTGNGQDLVFTNYGEHWRKMRRIMTVPFFTNKTVQQFRTHWEDEIDYAIADIKANINALTVGIVLRQRLQLFIYNNLYRMMFNRRFEHEDDPLFVQLKRLNGERGMLSQSFKFNYGDFIPILLPFLRGYLQRCHKVKDERLHLFKKYFVDQRKKMNSTGPPSKNERCVMDHILEAQANGEISEDNVLYIIENINVAAIETTLWTIEWVLAELVNNPDIQTKVRDELYTTLGQGVHVTEPDLSRLPYLQAVVKETLRMHMSIPLLMHMNVNEAKLGGYDIPAGSKVLINAWYMANNPELWDEPEKFVPERFLGPEKIDASGNDTKFLPFGLGRRSCPGIVLAIPIVSLVLARLVQTFELLPPPGLSKVDTSAVAGQFSLRIATHSTIVCKPL